jgi:mRNA interferase MazF
MTKNFEAWNDLKIKEDTKDRRSRKVFCKERDIWWMSFGLNIGDEEDGKGDLFERPVLVTKKFNNNLFWGCAMSTKIKENNKYYLPVTVHDTKQSVVISQMRLYDTKRLQEKIGVLNKEDFEKIKTAIKELL